MKKNLLVWMMFFGSFLLSAVAGAEENLQKKMHTLFVFSDPPLSEIYVDGVKQESPTPAVIRVPANAKPEIEIRHSGHQTFKTQISTRGSGSKFSAQLKRVPARDVASEKKTNDQ